MTIDSKNWWSRSLVWALVLTVLLQLGIAAITMHSPISNEKGLPVSPLHVAPSSDLSFYLDSRDLYLSGTILNISKEFTNFYTASTESARGRVLTAPVFPMLLALFDYRPNNTLPLATLFLVLGIVMTAFWLRYFEIRGMPTLWLLAFPFLPHVIWFTINVGTDLLAAAFFAGFYLTYFGAGSNRQRWAWGLVFLALMVLTRPNGVSVLLFVIVDQIFFKRQLTSNHRNWLIGASLVAVAPFVVFYFPYLFAYVSGSLPLPVFGIPSQQYLEGIYDGPPSWLNLLLSWLSLIGGKFLYLVGLRPSYSDTSLTVVLARAAPGLIYLPGIVHFFAVGDRSQRLLLALFLLPILFGAAQDRYLLPFQPLLFLHGTMVYTTLWLGLRQRLWRGGS